MLQEFGTLFKIPNLLWLFQFRIQIHPDFLFPGPQERCPMSTLAQSSPYARRWKIYDNAKSGSSCSSSCSRSWFWLWLRWRNTIHRVAIFLFIYWKVGMESGRCDGVSQIVPFHLKTLSLQDHQQNVDIVISETQNTAMRIPILAGWGSQFLTDCVEKCLVKLWLLQ